MECILVWNWNKLNIFATEKFGIGSDGLIMLNASDKNDFYMDFLIQMDQKAFVVMVRDVQ